MHTHPNGVPLESVNAVSATTTGAFDIFTATIHRHCSPLLTSTLVISLAITATSSIAQLLVSCFYSLLERDSNFDLFLLVLSVGAGSIWIDVDTSTFLIGAFPKDSFLVDDGYAVDILVAQNPHFHDNLQTQRILKQYATPVIGYNYGLG